MLSDRTAIRLPLGLAIAASTQLFIRRNTWRAKHRAPHVCTQSASAPDRRERRTIDMAAKARVRFPAVKPW